VGGVRIHQANDQASAEVMAERLRLNGVPAQILRGDPGTPYDGLGASAAFDILVPEPLAATARRILGGDLSPTRRGQRG
jgi:hypothetical protein